MSPALNGSAALQHFEYSNVIKICNAIFTQDCHICNINFYHTIMYLGEVKFVHEELKLSDIPKD